MVKLLIWLFYKRRFTYCDVLAGPAGFLVGGWWGFLVFVSMLFFGAWIGHIARWWNRDLRGLL